MWVGFIEGHGDLVEIGTPAALDFVEPLEVPVFSGSQHGSRGVFCSAGIPHKQVDQVPQLAQGCPVH